MYYKPDINYSHVYLINNPELNRCKIGISRDVRNRLNGLISSSGCKLELVYCSEKLHNYKIVEKKIHKKLLNCRYIGEWFNIDVDSALDVVEYIVESIGILHIEKKIKTNDKKINRSNNYIKESHKTIHDSINFNHYKRIKQGIYSDHTGKLYSIKYRIIDKKWVVSELTKIN